MNPESAVELHEVTKSFGSQVAVNRLNLTVPRGAIYGFIGPNGSGKTTTIRMILRIFRPETGSVQVLGKLSGDVADNRVGYLPEERGLYRRMTVRQVLRYFARLKGVRNVDATINEQLDRMGAREWDRKRIEQLSKGMAQKIQFIVAVIASPELVILDEPFSGMDPVNMEVLRDSIFEMRKKGTTVIFSTHDMDTAERMCDCVFMIHKGNKVLDGSIESVKSGYGGNSVRVRMANGNELPTTIPGVKQIIPKGRFHELVLESEDDRSKILHSLLQSGEIEHFESVRPSLHDIFVRIARIQEED